MPAALTRRVGAATSCRSTRRAVLLATAAWAILVLPLAPFAQQTAKVPRIGLLSPDPFPGERDVIILKRLAELGWIEGKTVAFERRSAQNNEGRLPALARELVLEKVDVIVAITTPAVQSAKDATSTIPIVMAPAGDALASAFVTNLAKPGGNITGVTFSHEVLAPKRLELLREVRPELERVAVLGLRNIRSLHQPMWSATEQASRVLKIPVRLFEIPNAHELGFAFPEMARARMNALVVLPAPGFAAERRRIAELASKHKLLSMCDRVEYVEAGCLMSYGASLTEILRQAAAQLDRILKGARAAELPVEQPIKYELAINVNTAKALGVTIPQSILVRADKVIE